MEKTYESFDLDQNLEAGELLDVEEICAQEAMNFKEGM
jgi:hypothetical protein